MKYILLCLLTIHCFTSTGQELKLRKRASNALSGTEFSKSISDSALSLSNRELIIFNEIRSGNIPKFYRNLVEIRDTISNLEKIHTIRYFVLPDFIAIGSDDDYFYCPMRPQLAQKVANLMKSSLPTRKISNQIYQNALLKMTPEPIPPSPQMITIPVFEKHNQIVNAQRKLIINNHPFGSLVAGNKKDVVISNRIYNDKGELRVVIYGWHKPDGKPIQPLYNGHSTIHVDYSHGIRLVQNKVWVNGKKASVQKVLKSEILNALLSDEGPIAAPFYPIN
ncbi:MAG: hypothetical protein WBJ10_17460 [Daejeonella sp.]|uniref:hypothetical protein n=1 Tax=Daejeonella sp. TaxID=2805397 RepID=UPI003C761AEF